MQCFIYTVTYRFLQMKESALLNRNIVFSVSLKRLNDGYLSTMSLVTCCLVVVLFPQELVFSYLSFFTVIIVGIFFFA